ncbi:MAG: hypothetical protein IPJ53_13115 [Saprospiraceae bacterium]|nr:hypothetical protein [Candidatus Vicinibacter affinis]
MEGYSNEEIGQFMNLQKNSVASYKSKCLDKFEELTLTYKILYGDNLEEIIKSKEETRFELLQQIYKEEMELIKFRNLLLKAQEKGS